MIIMSKVVKLKQTKTDKKSRKKTKIQTRILKHKTELLKAMVMTRGNITEACKMTGLNRNTFYDYFNNDPNFKQTVEDVAEMRVDFVEAQLDKLIEDMDSKAITFFLKTKGKNRGYVERTEIESKVDNRITINIVKPDKKTKPKKKKK